MWKRILGKFLKCELFYNDDFYQDEFELWFKFLAWKYEFGYFCFCFFNLSTGFGYSLIPAQILFSWLPSCVMMIWVLFLPGVILDWKKSQYCFVWKKKQKLLIYYGLTERQLVRFVSPEKLSGQPVKFCYNYLKLVWITSFFYWIWLRLFLQAAN